MWIFSYELTFWAIFGGAQKLLHFRLENFTSCCTFTISHFLKVSPPAAHLKTLKRVWKKAGTMKTQAGSRIPFLGHYFDFNDDSTKSGIAD